MIPTEIAINSLIQLFSLSALYFLLKRVIETYATERAKNLATKHDIEEITKKVEGIKADLLYINHNKNSINEAERQALISLNATFAEWFHYLRNITLSDVSIHRYDKLSEMLEEIKVRKLNFNIAEDKAHLFILDQDFREIKFKCVEVALALEYKIKTTIYDLLGEFKIGQAYFFQNPNLAVGSDKFIKEFEEFQKRIDTIFYSMHEEMTLNNESLTNARMILIQKIQEKLFTIK